LIAPLLSALIGFVALALIHVAVGAWQAHRRRWLATPVRNPVMPSMDWRDEECDVAPESYMPAVRPRKRPYVLRMTPSHYECHTIEELIGYLVVDE
jgi:hypothetical protein